jgi:hypothetical protein
MQKLNQIYENVQKTKGFITAYAKKISEPGPILDLIRRGPFLESLSKKFFEDGWHSEFA